MLLLNPKEYISNELRRFLSVDGVGKGVFDYVVDTVFRYVFEHGIEAHSLECVKIGEYIHVGFPGYNTMFTCPDGYALINPLRDFRTKLVFAVALGSESVPMDLHLADTALVANMVDPEFAREIIGVSSVDDDMCVELYYESHEGRDKLPNEVRPNDDVLFEVGRHFQMCAEALRKLRDASSLDSVDWSFLE